MASLRGTLNKMIKKRRRTQLNLEVKLNIIQMLEKGNKINNVAQLYSLNESTIRTIKKNAGAIKMSIKDAIPSSSKVVKYTRDAVIVKMEKLLIQWIEDNNKKHFSMDTRSIQTKALLIFNELKKENLENKQSESDKGKEYKSLTFAASKGWFDKFKKRYNLRNFKLVGKASNFNKDAATEFVNSFKVFIEDNGYTPQQVFNCDETGLFWKRMPSRTFISKEENATPGFKSAKDRLTLLFCANASGDYKCKPLLIYHSSNPLVLKNVDKSSLPVYWESNKKSWMTGSLFEDWFNNMFCSEVEEYCRVKKISFKILLVVDNAPSHPVNFDSLNPNVKVMFISPNTTALIQPMDQGVIATFKKYYLKHTFKEMFDALEADKNTTLHECWRNYNIANAVQNIKSAWEGLNNTTMNAAWKNLWPNCISSSTNNTSSIKTIDKDIAEIVAVGQCFEGEGFSDMNASDIEELIQSHDAELTAQELVALNQEKDNEKQEQEDY